MPKRAILYARVSGDDRHTEGRNLIGQLEMCREYARRRGYSVVAELAEDDRGASGAAFELPQLNRVRELAQAGAFDVLIARELDRLSRSLAKQLIVEEELKRQRVSIEYVLGEYPDTPEGGLLKNVRAVIAEYERLKIAERLARGRQRAIAAGSVLGHGSAPYGYRLVQEDHLYRLVVDEDEAEIVRQIFHLYSRADRPLSICQIAEELTQRGVPSAADLGRSRSGRKREGGWSPVTITQMLRNETYSGVWHYRKSIQAPGARDKRRRITRSRSEWLPVTVPAIIDPETWSAAVARRAANQDAAKRYLQHPERYLLRRRVICGACGAKLVGTSPTVGKQYAYYRCPATQPEKGYARRCSARGFRADAVDAVVWGWLVERLERPDILAAGLAKLREQRAAQVEPLDAELIDTDRQLKDILRQGERLLDAYQVGEITHAQFTTRTSRLRDQEERLTSKLQGLQQDRGEAVPSEADVAGVLKLAASIAEELVDAADDIEFRRYVVERLAVRVVLSNESDCQRWTLSSLLGPADGLVPRASHTRAIS